MLNRLCEYNNWANSLLFNALTANFSTVPESCILLFSHIVNAQTIWVCRINGTLPDVGVWQLHNSEACKMLLEKSANQLLEITGKLKPKDAEVIRYTTSTGDYYETSVFDILLHVFNHGTYHRAQIAKEMKLHNIKPVGTDYIQFVRLQ